MAEVLGIENDTNLSTDDMAKIFQEKSDKGEVTSAEVIIPVIYTRTFYFLPILFSCALILKRKEFHFVFPSVLEARAVLEEN